MAAAHPWLANLPESSWDTDSISATQGPRRENGNAHWAKGVGQLGYSNGVFICGTRPVGKESQRRKRPQPGLQCPLQQWQDGQGYWQGCYCSVGAGVGLGQRQCDAGLCWKLNPLWSQTQLDSVPRRIGTEFLVQNSVPSWYLLEARPSILYLLGQVFLLCTERVIGVF